MYLAIVLLALELAGVSGDPNLVQQGYLEPIEVITVGPARSGRLDVVLVTPGDRVEPEQELARLELAVEEASARLARLKSESGAAHAEAVLRAERAVARADRARRLHERKMISEDEIEHAEFEARLTRVLVQKADEAQRIARLEYERAVAAIERGIVRSPIAGIVIAQHSRRGEFVLHDREEGLFRVARTDQLLLRVYPTADLFGRYEIGTRALLQIEEGDPRVIVGDITYVDPIVDPASGTFEVRIEVRNEDGAIPAGVSCTLRWPRP